MISFGSFTSPTSKPKDLDAQLLAATGCDAAEVTRMLGGHPLADLTAKALRPFLASPPDDLVEQIDAAGPDARAAVLALYASAGIDPAPTPEPLEPPAPHQEEGKANG